MPAQMGLASEAVPDGKIMIGAMEEAAAVAAVVATEHSEDDSMPEVVSQEVPAGRMMIYCIVNQFLGNVLWMNYLQ